MFQHTRTRAEYHVTSGDLAVPGQLITFKELTMRKNAIDRLNLTKTIQQIEFARGMNTKQWTALHTLSEFQFPLSASEWSDPDMIALFKNGLVWSQSSNDGTSTNWAATEAGSNLVKLRAENFLFW
jgi:hypothetical protein